MLVKFYIHISLNFVCNPLILWCMNLTLVGFFLSSRPTLRTVRQFSIFFSVQLDSSGKRNRTVIEADLLECFRWDDCFDMEYTVCSGDESLLSLIWSLLCRTALPNWKKSASLRGTSRGTDKQNRILKAYLFSCCLLHGRVPPRENRRRNQTRDGEGPNSATNKKRA